MTVPVVFDKPTNIVQASSGILMVRGRRSLLAAHLMNAGLIAVVVGIHAFLGIGVWFFSFRYG